MKWGPPSSCLDLPSTPSSSLTPIACSTNNLSKTDQRYDCATSRRSPQSFPFENCPFKHIRLIECFLPMSLAYPITRMGTGSPPMPCSYIPFPNLYPLWRLCSFVTLNSVTTHQYQNAEQAFGSITKSSIGEARMSYHQRSTQLLGYLQEVDPYRAFLCSQPPASASHVHLPDRSRDVERSRAPQQDEAHAGRSVMAGVQYRTLHESSAPVSHDIATGTSTIPQHPVVGRSQQTAAQYVREWTAYWESLVPNDGTNNDRGKSV